jgi:plasmid stabilization system protein ParE
LTYRVEITDRALLDVDQAHSWIAEHISVAQANRWLHGLFRAIATLKRRPLRCPLAAENDKFPYDIREFLYGKRWSVYRIIFTVRDDAVVVLYVHHGARDEISF